jgi:DNA-binding CsgD family transcriptional regulator
MSTIFVIEGAAMADTPPRFILRDAVSLLGRSDDCDIVIEAPSVSRRHAQLAVRGSAVIVTDMGSTNGTFVDDQPVQRATALSGQRLRFGKVSFLLSEQMLRCDGPHDEEKTEDCNSDEPASIIRCRAMALPQSQRRVYDLLLSGISNKQIAQQLDLSPHTVHTHVRAIFKALCVHSRSELLACLANGKK